MNHAAIAQADVAIFGGGIAGLWLLNRLRQQGYTAILFETDSLGGGQTSKSQGIIHGGMKYALQGVFTNDAKAMLDMPIRWKACLEGTGEIDLSDVPVLSQQQYLWSPGKFVSKITGFLASTTLSSKVNALDPQDYPAIFKNAKFKGEVYALDELVIDVPAAVHTLAQKFSDSIYKIAPLCADDLTFDASGKLIAVQVTPGLEQQTSQDFDSDKKVHPSVTLHAQQFVFAAGAGNELLGQHLKEMNIGTQRRPLHMVMVKVPFDYPVYAHCLGLGSRPRVTITSHRLSDGRWVWYLGGSIAEDGIKKNKVDQIKATKAELKSLFPWLDFTAAEFDCFLVDRAEPLQKNGYKPETSFIKSIQNINVVWPTKLALAPKLSDEMMAHFAEHQLIAGLSNVTALASWPKPTVAITVWEEVFCKNAN